MLSEELGYELEEIHGLLLTRFLPVGKNSTTELSTLEFKTYCEKIQIWAAKEHQLNIPDPNEKTDQTQSDT